MRWQRVWVETFHQVNDRSCVENERGFWMKELFGWFVFFIPLAKQASSSFAFPKHQARDAARCSGKLNFFKLQNRNCSNSATNSIISGAKKKLPFDRNFLIWRLMEEGKTFPLFDTWVWCCRLRSFVHLPLGSFRSLIFKKTQKIHQIFVWRFNGGKSSPKTQRDFFGCLRTAKLKGFLV